MKLYEINDEIARLLERVDPETGEVPDELLDALNALEITRRDKAINLALWIKSIEAEGAAHADEAKKQMAKAKALDKQAERLRNYISFCVPEGEEIKDARVKIGYRKSVYLDVPEGLALSDLLDTSICEYIKIKHELNKAELKNDLKTGALDPVYVGETFGINLSERFNLQIS